MTTTPILSWDYVSQTMPDTGGWKSRHSHIMTLGAHPMASAIRSWVKYAQNHAREFDSDIGHDYVLGPAWARWGAALRELLNGDLGRMDAGTLDHIIYTNLKNQGYDPDML